MKIDVIMTEKIFRRFTMFDILRRRKMWRAPALFAAILGGCAIVCFVMSHVRGAVFLGSTLMVIGVGLPLNYFVTFFLSLANQIKTMGLKEPRAVYTLILTNSPKGIHVENATEKADYEWKNVYHAYRDASAVYLYMTPARAFVLPDASLTESTGEELWKLISKKVGAEKCTVL